MLKNAKDFCRESGFPVAYIRRLCRLGVLPYWKCGRMYLLDDKRTLERLESLKEQAPAPPYVSEPVPARRKHQQKPTEEVHDRFSTGSERLRQLLKMKKAQETATGLNKKTPPIKDGSDGKHMTLCFLP